VTTIRLRPARREDRQLAWLWFAAAASAVVLRPVWIAVAPWLRPCAFRSLTGLPCPTCGTTRAALALLDLDLGAAFAVNPLAALTGVGFIVGGVLAAVWALRRGPVPVISRSFARILLWSLIVAVLANWLYLIVTR
jgi:hypothetical protein